MSRGPGFWQRAILAAVDQADSFYLVDVLPDGYTKSQYNAANRAALKLADDGRISMTRSLCGTLKVVIGKPDIKPQRPARVKCWIGDIVSPIQHLTLAGR